MVLQVVRYCLYVLKVFAHVCLIRVHMPVRRGDPVLLVLKKKKKKVDLSGCVTSTVHLVWPLDVGLVH